MLAVFALVVAALGFGAGAAIFSLREQVSRWAALEAAASSHDALKRALIAGAPVEEVQKAFADAARSVDSIDWHEGHTMLAAATDRARVAHLKASMQSDAADEALAEMEGALARLETRIAIEVRRASAEASRGARESATIQQEADDDVARMRALLRASMLVERIQTRLQAYAQFSDDAGAVALDVSDTPPDCDDRLDESGVSICSPAAARLRDAVAAYRASGSTENGAHVVWAAGAFLRALEAAYSALDVDLAGASAEAERQRERLKALRQREEGLNRLARVVWDLRKKYGKLRHVEDAGLDDLDGAIRGGLQQIAARGEPLLSAAEAGRRSAPDVDAIVADLESAWRSANSAERARRMSADRMTVAVTDMDRNVTAAAEAVRAVAEGRVSLFAINGALLAALVVVVAAILAWAAHARFASPLAKVIGAIMRLSGGDAHSPVETRPHGDPFGPVFAALEDLRVSQRDRLRYERDAADARIEAERQHIETERLQAQLSDEREKMEFLRKIVSIVNHELRTPLAVIDGNAHQIARRAARGDMESVTQKSTTIRTSVARLTGIMETFLLSATLDKGAIEYRPTPFDLGEMIEDVCALHREASSCHAILTVIHDAPKAYAGDVRLLRQALGNLLSNAVKYSPDVDRIEVGCEVRDGMVRIAVRDFGYGIPEDEIARIGTQFFRASTNNGVMGTGVGLNLVKALAQVHGGGLEIASRVGEGSTFTLVLPTEPPDPAQPHAQPHAQTVEPTPDAAPDALETVR
ncbi:Signal transduction histidine kinase [Rubrimonas cliftonensis]|uniref:histidine kinase n=2 Tax=Rubrimonas cliftonensis TaxID=89524 RepID=A0A1H4FR88_9RHOB|nr:Signal transduction histidine kinase [Rubrimonas cliftonensis]